MRVPHMIAVILIWAVLPASSMLVGCAPKTRQIDVSTASHEDFRRLLDERRHFEAYLVYLQLKPELDKMDEGAGGFEYSLLVGTASGSGEASWAQILKSPAIPLHYKLDLVEDIDYTARLEFDEDEPAPLDQE